MNDKILIEGKFSKLNSLALFCYIMAALVIVSCFIVATIFGGDPSWVFRGMEYGYYWFFIGTFLFALLGFIFRTMKFELIVTEGKVVGKTLFGKRVDLPIGKISVVGTGMFRRLSIATSAGAIHSYGVINRDEVFKTVSELLIKHQEETKVGSINANVGSMEELKKMKELLDMGIITQEEFDAKKKQLLGL